MRRRNAFILAAVSALALAVLAAPIVWGSALGLMLDAGCRLDGYVSDQDRALMKKKRYEFPIRIDYERAGRRFSASDTRICHRPRLAYGFDCVGRLEWDEDWRGAGIAFAAGAQRNVDLTPYVCLDLAVADPHAGLWLRASPADRGDHDLSIDEYERRQWTREQLQRETGIRILSAQILIGGAWTPLELPTDAERVPPAAQ